MVTYLLDTYAWIEYLIGSSKGEIVRKLFLDKNNDFLTAECSLSELKGWSIREKADFARIYSTVKANSHIEPIHLDDWLIAAQIKSEMRKNVRDFGLMDSLLLAKAKSRKCKIVSGDPHFEKLPGVLYLN